MSTNDADDGRRTDLLIDARASDHEELGTVVLTAIADEMDTDPASLPPLGESIDPDLLNRFRDADGASATALSFEYVGYEVVVTSDGVVQLHSLT